MKSKKEKRGRREEREREIAVAAGRRRVAPLSPSLQREIGREEIASLPFAVAASYLVVHCRRFHPVITVYVTQSGSGQRLLATLRDHFGSVNCVRWAKHGRYIASGSDDQAILVHERKPGICTADLLFLGVILAWLKELLGIPLAPS